MSALQLGYLFSNATSGTLPCVLAPEKALPVAHYCHPSADDAYTPDVLCRWDWSLRQIHFFRLHGRAIHAGAFPVDAICQMDLLPDAKLRATFFRHRQQVGPKPKPRGSG